MPRKQPPPIEVVAYVHVGDKLVNVDDLNQSQRQELATKLTLTFMNTLYRGKAVFTAASEKKVKAGE